MNHKRRRPKSQRAGCLLCKPWKAECYSQRSVGGREYMGGSKPRQGDDAAIAEGLEDVPQIEPFHSLRNETFPKLLK